MGHRFAKDWMLSTLSWKVFAVSMKSLLTAFEADPTTLPTSSQKVRGHRRDGIGALSSIQAIIGLDSDRGYQLAIGSGANILSVQLLQLGRAEVPLDPLLALPHEDDVHDFLVHRVLHGPEVLLQRLSVAERRPGY
eukprot:7741073-Pyramimonas_sp.AAC.1